MAIEQGAESTDEAVDAVDEVETELADEAELSNDDVEDVDDGQADDSAADSDEVDTSETYIARVNGEDIEVTLEELVNGYQRQADYTRKTQRLSAQAEQLKAYEQFDQALAANPFAAVQALAQHYGFSLADNGTSGGSQPEALDPLEAKVAQLESRWDEHQATQRQDALTRQIEAIGARNNDPELDAVELLQFAVDHSIGDLDVAYEALTARKARQQATQADTKTVAVRRKRTAPKVEGGQTRSNRTVVPGSSESVTVAEAWRLAKQELGLS